MAQESILPKYVPQATADLPPAMAEIKSQSVDEVIKEMNRMPLFMTTLDETDGEGGENVALEALKALAYEGTRTEVAENFRQQGNECARAKQWSDAKEFYDKAIAALKAPPQSPDPEDGPPVIEVVEVDEQDEAKKEKEIEEACYVNRALCNLEKSKCGTWAAIRGCSLDCSLDRAPSQESRPQLCVAFMNSSILLPRPLTLHISALFCVIQSLVTCCPFL